MTAIPHFAAQRRFAHGYALSLAALCALLFLIGFPAAGYGQPADTREVFVAGSGNDALDQYVIRLIEERVRETLVLRPLSDWPSPSPHNVPVIAIGPAAVTRAQNLDPPPPVLALLVKKSSVEDYPGRPGSQLSAVYQEVPLIRQALTGKAILPQATRIALLASTDSSDLYQPLLGQLEAFGLEARIFVADTNDQLIPALNRALSYGDFLLAGPDDAIYNPRNIKHILLTAYRRNKILIGPNQIYVKAGALASSYPPMDTMADQASRHLEQFLATGHFPPSDYPIEYRVEVNEQVARSLNIPLPDPEQIASTINRMLEENAGEMSE